ncbi:MAG TPA: hypothetical protein VNL91_05520 [Thermoanaerobaculia bacterium]|nr:hypothetical protein [Thermoanaerobaculia bacterium]
MKTEDAERPCSRLIRFLSSFDPKDTYKNMVALAAAADTISSSLCPEHGIHPIIGTTFGESGYVSACCEAMLDRIESTLRG